MKRAIENQVVVITGASSGIGRCTALYLAGRGARLVLTARRADALEELVREIEGAGGQAIAVAGNVTREDDLRAVAEAAVGHFGRIDGFRNRLVHDGSPRWKVPYCGAVAPRSIFVDLSC